MFAIREIHLFFSGKYTYQMRENKPCLVKKIQQEEVLGIDKAFFVTTLVLYKNHSQKKTLEIHKKDKYI